MANRCTTKLVEPPSAALTLMAFSMAGRVKMRDMRKSSRTISTMRLPARCPKRLRRASGPGIAAPLGSVSPTASTMQAIVEAVPMVMQWPSEREIPASASR